MDQPEIQWTKLKEEWDRKFKSITERSEAEVVGHRTSLLETVTELLVDAGRDETSLDEKIMKREHARVIVQTEIMRTLWDLVDATLYQKVRK